MRALVAAALVGCPAVPPEAVPDTLAVRVSTRSAPACAPRAARFRRHGFPTAPWPDEAELTSGGLGVADLDGDGFLDVFLPHETASALWLGTGGDFVDATDRLAGLDLGDAVGAAIADADGDGDLDVFVTRWRRPNLLLGNDGTGHFHDVTDRAGVGGGDDRHQSAVWADVDADRDLDLFVGSYGPEPDDEYRFDDPTLPPSRDRKHLYVNDGSARFVERSELLPVGVQDGYTFQATFLDTSGDGLPELFQWNDFGSSHPSRALANAGGVAFRYDPGRTAIDRPFEDMGVGIADLDADGLPDFAITSYQRLGLLLSSPDANPVGSVWSDWAAARGLATAPEQEFGWGVAFGDLDHDRDEDLVVAFGDWARYVSPRFQRDGVWRNDGDTFVQVAPEWGLDDDGVGRGLLLADLDDDGSLDVVKRPLDGGASVDFGRCDLGAWLTVALHQASADTRALGARIRVASTDGVVQTRWIVAGGSSLYSSGPPVAHFGLGAREDAVEVEVRWPDGATSRTRLPPRVHADLWRQ